MHHILINLIFIIKGTCTICKIIEIIPKDDNVTGLRHCQVELRFSTRACVCKLVKYNPGSYMTNMPGNIHSRGFWMIL